MAAYKNSKIAKKSHTLFSTADTTVSSSSSPSDNSNLYASKEVAAMASFSIEGLLGLGKDRDGQNGAANNKKSTEGSSVEQAATKDASTSNDAATTNGKPMPQDKNNGPSTAATGACGNDTDQAKAKVEETLHESEQEDSTELVTVEVRTMHASRSVSRSSSRKRKRTSGSQQSYKEQRDSTPESDGKFASILGKVECISHD